MTWQIGNVLVDHVCEVETTVQVPDMYPGASVAQLDPYRSWLEPHFVTPEGALTLSIRMLVVRSMGQVVVVDTCLGEHSVPGHERLDDIKGDVLGTLSAQGVDPAAVDVVLCTHLHFDHVGWNTRREGDRWVPTFPHARYLFAREEYAYWAGGGEGFALTFRDAVEPVVASGQADLVATDHVINDELRLLPTPGHSPGHVSLVIESAGARAVITGDVVHHPVQFALDTWSHIADGDAEAARTTRLAFRDRFVDTGAVIFGTHFAGPGCGQLVRDGRSYRFEV